MPALKKYKLFSIKDGVKPVCAFFLSPAGCRNGEKCPFLHEQERERIVGRSMEVSDSASIISSESEGGLRNSKDCSMSTQEQSDKKKKQENSGEDHDNPFASRLQNKVRERESPSGSCNQKKKARHVPNLQQETECDPRSNSQNQLVMEGQTSKPNQNVSRSDDCRSFASNLPVASFPALGRNGFLSPSQPKKPEKTSYVVELKEKRPLPTSTESGRKWKAVVMRTREHERYSSSFDFARYKQKHREAGIQSDWIKAKKFGQWCLKNPQAIAIGCEMCETKDPLSGSKNPKALCRISVINAECPDEVLLDTLVKPNWPVCDYRTRINGIEKEHLNDVQFTLRHAQAFMMALCSDETVIVGHAVHNDLVALNMEHQCIADASCLFHAKGDRSATVSLRDLVSTIFQEKMPDTHDSVNDARKALSCAVHWAKKSGYVAEVVRSTDGAKSAQLFVHRVPKYCKAQNLYCMFQKHTDIVPKQVDEVEFSGTTGKTHVTFRTSWHASLAFDTLDGSSEPDKSGRLQKKVYLKNGDYVRIRKMTHEKANSENPIDAFVARS